MNLPPDLRMKNLRFTRLSDRMANLAGKLLLIKGLDSLGIQHDNLQKIKYSVYHRPYIDTSIDFNITHSGEYAMCAIIKGAKVGIDIEKMNAIAFDDFAAVFTNDEWKIIKTSANPLKTFYTFWTIKESIAKGDGKGLLMPLNSIYIDEQKGSLDGQVWHFKPIEIDEGYSACVAINAEPGDLNIQYLSLTSG